MSNFAYCLKQGFINIKRNKMFSLASIVTIGACIFLFGIFYSIVVNVQFMAKNAESTIGVSVYFDEGMDETEMNAIGEQIRARQEVDTVTFISAEEAWAEYKQKYFGDNLSLADGFKDNPLANSASYKITLKNTEDQPQLVEWLQNLSGIRKVKYSETAAGGLSSLNSLIGYISLAIISILLIVSLLLISNTISLAYAVRKEEIEVTKWMGATNVFVRAPFVVEGLLIGLIGAILPLLGVFVLYRFSVMYILTHFSLVTDFFVFLPVETVFEILIPVVLLLGAGIGFLGSFFTIRKQLRV